MYDKCQAALKFKRSAIEKKAQLRSIASLLNCYCREHAAPRNEVVVNPVFGRKDWPEALKISLNKHNDQSILILLPEINGRIVVRVKDLKQLGQCRFTSTPYYKKIGEGWRKLNQYQLTQVLLHHLALVFKQPYNSELANQIQNSLINCQAFLAELSAAERSRYAENSLKRDGFIESEQALIWGHAWHPAPKSREGIDESVLLNISPEVGASFRLHFLAVKSECLQLMSSEGFDCLQALDQLCSMKLEAGYHGLPCHPYQYEKFKTNPLFIYAKEQGLILDLGEIGEKWHPTSSVRTLYNGKREYFLKFSLHVRLTNCVRKNSWYELESAIYLNSLISKCRHKTLKVFPSFDVLQEPGSVTLNLKSALRESAGAINDQHAIELSEAFGLLFRASFSPQTLTDMQPRVAASLFADTADFNQAVLPYVEALASAHALDYSKAALFWFKHYVNALLPPVLYYFFKLGIVFEPHLQNTVVGFNRHVPTHIYLRDLEGTKLVDVEWPESALALLSVRAKQSIHYSRSQGWKRIAYCTLINNISEAIYHLSGDSVGLEKNMWRQVVNVIENYQLRFGSEPELIKLLEGEGIPCKCNLITRLFKRADREADYVLIPNPMAVVS